MRYGTSKSTGPFRLTISISDEPRCPGCTEFLQPCVIEFRDGWAWCAICAAHGLHGQPHIAFVMLSDEMCRCSRIVNGLRFYVPDVFDGKVLTAYEWYESQQLGPAPPETDWQPDGVYALTPSGEHLLADLDVSPLEEVQRDLQSVSSRNGQREEE